MKELLTFILLLYLLFSIITFVIILIVIYWLQENKQRMSTSDYIMFTVFIIFWPLPWIGICNEKTNRFISFLFRKIEKVFPRK